MTTDAAKPSDDATSDAAPNVLEPSSAIRTSVGAASVFLFVMWFLPRQVPIALALISYAAVVTMVVGFFAYRWNRRAAQIRLNTALSLASVLQEKYCLYLRPFATSAKLLVRNNLPKRVDRLIIGAFWDFELSLSFALAQMRTIGLGHVSGGYGAAKLSADDGDWFTRFQQLQPLLDTALTTAILWPSVRLGPEPRRRRNIPPAKGRRCGLYQASGWTSRRPRSNESWASLH